MFAKIVIKSKNLEDDPMEVFQSKITQEKFLCSLVLKLKVFFAKYLQEHYIRCMMRAALFLKNVPGTFFNATHQVKAIAIGVSKANPLVEIG